MDDQYNDNHDQEGAWEEAKTERQQERKNEEQDFTGVIIKRSDEAQRHPDDILQKCIVLGLEQLERPFVSLFLSAMAAGLILGFTAMSVAIVQSEQILQASSFYSRLPTALVYPLGFVLCIMSGTELFTEHTATAVYPILDRRGTVRSLMRLWGVVIVGNITGAWLSAGLLVSADDVIGARKGYIEIARHFFEFSQLSLFMSALLAGWLMALGAWLVMATRPNLSQMVSIYIVTFIIGIGGLHHSISGSVEIFTAYLISNEFSLFQVGYFVFPAIFGNLVGGSIFVALLNYGHIRETQKKLNGS